MLRSEVEKFNSVEEQIMRCLSGKINIWKRIASFDANLVFKRGNNHIEVCITDGNWLSGD